MKNKFKQSLLFTLLTFFLVGGNLAIDRWPDTLYFGDSNGYYLHVVSFFVNQDVGDYEQTISSLQSVHPAAKDPRLDEFGIRMTEKGRRYIKYTLGVPLMETPFFLVAHAYATVSARYAVNGWTKPYLFSVGFALVFYVLLGLLLLQKVLLRYFNWTTVALVLITLVVATNLFYQTTYVTMSHGFLFFQHCLLIWLTVKFYERPGWGSALAVGMTVGLIALTRVPEAIAILVPLLWGVTNKETLWKRWHFFCDRPRYLLVAGSGLIAVFSIQLFYWHYVSGKLVFNPYAGEGFNFLRPMIHRGWFDFKNGWLIYTPIMAFGLYGLFRLRRYAAAAFWPVLAFVFLNAYIHYSYYVWSYFPGMGQRPMVDSYPLLAFGLAAAFTDLKGRKGMGWLPLAAIVVFGSLNLFQTWQLKQGVIWTERHNAAFYWATFGAMEVSRDALRAYDTRSLQPDSTDLHFHKLLFHEDFEPDRLSTLPNGTAGTATTANEVAMETEGWELRNTYTNNGGQSLYTTAAEYIIVDGLLLLDARPRDYLKIRVAAFMAADDLIFNRDACLGMIVELSDGTGRKRRGQRLAVSPHLGNVSNSIWTAGDPDAWGEAYFFMQLPSILDENWTAKIRLSNPYGQRLHLDDLKVELYR